MAVVGVCRGLEVATSDGCAVMLAEHVGAFRQNEVVCWCDRNLIVPCRLNKLSDKFEFNNGLLRAIGLSCCSEPLGRSHDRYRSHQLLLRSQESD